MKYIRSLIMIVLALIVFHFGIFVGLDKGFDVGHADGIAEEILISGPAHATHDGKSIKSSHPYCDGKNGRCDI